MKIIMKRVLVGVQLLTFAAFLIGAVMSQAAWHQPSYDDCHWENSTGQWVFVCSSGGGALHGYQRVIMPCPDGGHGFVYYCANGGGEDECQGENHCTF